MNEAPYFFARKSVHPKTYEPLPGVSVMKSRLDRRDDGRLVRDTFLVSHHADLASAMAEVRRLNEQVEA